MYAPAPAIRFNASKPVNPASFKTFLTLLPTCIFLDISKALAASGGIVSSASKAVISGSCATRGLLSPATSYDGGLIRDIILLIIPPGCAFTTPPSAICLTPVFCVLSVFAFIAPANCAIPPCGTPAALTTSWATVVVSSAASLRA